MTRQNEVTIEEFKKASRAMIESDDPEVRDPVLIRGRHGIGKSDLVYQLSRDLGFDDDHIIERRASQMMEGDLIGLPEGFEDMNLPDWVVQAISDYLADEDTDYSELQEEAEDRKFTQWLPPEWLWKSCREPCALFFDEVDRARISVRQGLFELTGSRKIYGNELHPQTVIFAAINGGEADGAQYTVGEMDPAELDRWWTVDLEPKEEEFLSYAEANDFNRFVVEFIDQDPSHLEKKGDHSSGEVAPSRRSWERLSTTLNEKYGDRKPDREFAYLHGMGYLGHETAIQFADFVEEYEESANLEDVLGAEDFDEILDIAEYPMPVHNKIGRQFIANEIQGEDLEQSEIDNFAHYLYAINDELTMAIFKGTDYDVEVLRDRLFNVEIEFSEGEEFGDYFTKLYQSDTDIQDVGALGEDGDEDDGDDD